MSNFEIQWEDRFESGFTTVDNQHKKLFGLFSIFASAYAIGEDKHIVSEFLIELEDYTTYHFSEEQKLMLENNSRLSDEHLKQHAKFQKFLHDMKFEYESENKAISLELLSFLRTWLINHIEGIDLEELNKIRQ